MRKRGFFSFIILAAVAVLASAQVAWASSASEEPNLPFGIKSLPALIVFGVAAIGFVGIAGKYVVDALGRQSATNVDRSAPKDPYGYATGRDGYDDTIPSGYSGGGRADAGRDSYSGSGRSEDGRGGYSGGGHADAGRESYSGSGRSDDGRGGYSGSGYGDAAKPAGSPFSDPRGRRPEAPKDSYGSDKGTDYEATESVFGNPKGYYGAGSAKPSSGHDDSESTASMHGGEFEMLGEDKTELDMPTTRGFDDEAASYGESTVAAGAPMPSKIVPTVKFCSVTLKEERETIAKTFKDSLLFGRSAASDVRFDDPTVSREHFKLVAINGRLTLEHLSKSTPTFINSAAVNESVDLTVGDTISFGRKSVRIEKLEWISRTSVDDTLA
jgi:hypothetical protein